MSATAERLLDNRHYKCSAVDEMGDRFPTVDMDRKEEWPQFSANICCSQMALWIKMSLGMELGFYLGDFVLVGDPAPLPITEAEPPKIAAHVYCGQTARWIKIVFGTEVGLRPVDFVLHGTAAPYLKRGGAPNFWSTFIVAKRLHASRCHLVRR